MVLSPGPLKSLAQRCLVEKRDEKGGSLATWAGIFRKHTTESGLSLPLTSQSVQEPDIQCTGLNVQQWMGCHFLHHGWVPWCKGDNELGQGLAGAGTLVGADVFTDMHCLAPRGQHCSALFCSAWSSAQGLCGVTDTRTSCIDAECQLCMGLPL